MADQLLSVQDSSLNAVAQAIKNKSGDNTPLQFPDDFVMAIRGLDTYPNAADRVVGQTVTLTPANTSYSVPAGTHDGTDVIQIVLQNKTVTPTTSAITVSPDSGKFLGTVTVNASSGSSGYQVKTGSITLDNVGTFRISGLGFTPQHCLILLQSYHATASLFKVVNAHTNSFGADTDYFGVCGDKNKKALKKKSASSADMFQFESNAIVVSNENIRSSTNKDPTPVFAGTYYYVVWG